MIFDTKLVVEPGVPDGIRTRLGELWSGYRAILPRWLETLRIGYDGDDAENNATINYREEYRYARIVLAPNFFALTRGEQEESFRHEIAHLFNSRGLDELLKLVEDLELAKDHPALERSVRRRVTEAAEREACDLADGLARILRSRGSIVDA